MFRKSVLGMCTIVLMLFISACQEEDKKNESVDTSQKCWAIFFNTSPTYLINKINVKESSASIYEDQLDGSSLSSAQYMLIWNNNGASSMTIDVQTQTTGYSLNTTSNVTINKGQIAVYSCSYASAPTYSIQNASSYQAYIDGVLANVQSDVSASVQSSADASFFKSILKEQ
jgi:hypothetical protein